MKLALVQETTVTLRAPGFAKKFLNALLMHHIFMPYKKFGM